jgi:hypothetical protein
VQSNQFSGQQYVWIQKPVTARRAPEVCAELVDGGKNASLVIFETQEQREQIFYELIHMNPPAKDFWIGMSLSAEAEGGPTWTWDNGNTLYPSPWGDHEPTRVEAGTRAFARQTGKTDASPARTYESPAMTYDTQLAHVPDGGDETETHPVLCQITPR